MEYEVWKVTCDTTGAFSFEVMLFDASVNDYTEMCAVHLSNRVKVDLWLVSKESTVITCIAKFKTC
jgi:hypothetical protein